MNDEAGFLESIAEEPEKQLTRLVYADWLDERNDPRGELVRIEEEVRFEPAWSDVLWSQKPRRNELRAMCDPAWLTAMGYGTDCLPLFYGRPFPDHWRDGWRLIREATERWLGVPMPDVGGHAGEVAAVEKRLGLTLPPSVRELVAYLHDAGETRDGHLFWTHYHLRVEELPDVSAVSLLHLSHHTVVFAVEISHFGVDDPPVRRYEETWDFPMDRIGQLVQLSPRPNYWPTVTEFVFQALQDGHSERNRD